MVNIWPWRTPRSRYFDLGFTRSDVVYDVVSTWKGLFFRLDEHVERFLNSAAGIRIQCPYDPAEIKTIPGGMRGPGGFAGCLCIL